MEGYELNERRSWLTKDNWADMRVYMGIQGSIPLSDLVAYLAERDVSLANATVNFGTVSWVEPATGEEIESRRAAKEKSDQRHAQWERETWERLRAKYGDGAAE
ncbi:MAG TPA: hypothetical protein VFX53_05010 [Pedococcus sp.]|nr:hypothetical protein [Pedococcus sp.]